MDRVPISADGRHCCGHGVEDCLLRRFNDSLIQRIHPMISKHRNGKSSIVRPTWNCVSRRKSNYKFTAANGTWRPGASKAVCYPLGKLRQLTMYQRGIRCDDDDERAISSPLRGEFRNFSANRNTVDLQLMAPTTVGIYQHTDRVSPPICGQHP